MHGWEKFQNSARLTSPQSPAPLQRMNSDRSYCGIRERESVCVGCIKFCYTTITTTTVQVSHKILSVTDGVFNWSFFLFFSFTWSPGLLGTTVQIPKLLDKRDHGGGEDREYQRPATIVHHSQYCSCRWYHYHLPGLSINASALWTGVSKFSSVFTVLFLFLLFYDSDVWILTCMFCSFLFF